MCFAFFKLYLYREMDEGSKFPSNLTVTNPDEWKRHYNDGII